MKKFKDEMAMLPEEDKIKLENQIFANFIYHSEAIEEETLPEEESLGIILNELVKEKKENILSSP